MNARARNLRDALQDLAAGELMILSLITAGVSKIDELRTGKLEDDLWASTMLVTLDARGLIELSMRERQVVATWSGRQLAAAYYKTMPLQKFVA